jgi:PIN domain nuclease of toxin-antitoxin system
VVHWWSAEPGRVGETAAEALEEADEHLVAAISWYEPAWPARHERIDIDIPIRSWLQSLAAQLRTIGVTPAIADTAAALPSSFPGDPADRLIYATAIEHGVGLVTKDRAIRDHDRPRTPAIFSRKAWGRRLSGPGQFRPAERGEPPGAVFAAQRHRIHRVPGSGGVDEEGLIAFATQ